MRKIDEAKSEERRQHILKAALTCFRRSGFRSASISEICREAGMSPGHLYYYFASKEEIMDAVTDEARKVAPPLFDRLWGSASLLDSLTGRAEPTQRAEAVLDHPWQTSGALSLEIYAEAARSDRLMQPLRRNFQMIVAEMAHAIGDAQARGEIVADVDPRALAGMLLAMNSGREILQLVDPEFERDVLQPVWSDLAVRFLQPAETSPRKPAKPAAPAKKRAAKKTSRASEKV